MSRDSYNKDSRELPKGVYEERKRYRAQTWDKNGKNKKTVGIFDTPNEARYARVVALNNGEHHWEGIPIDKDAWGFIYLVTDLTTGKLYIGKKQLRLWNGPRGGYKCTDTSRSFFTPSAWKDNDWPFYITSCEPLKKQVAKVGVSNFKWEVVENCQDKLSLHLAEVLSQMEADVLEAIDSNGNYKYYNANIAGQEFRAPFRRADVDKGLEESMVEVERYYLKPTYCKKCWSMMKFGQTKCKCEE